VEAQEPFLVPSNCPVCGGPSSEEGEFLFCRSKSCPVQLSGSVRVWIKRLGLLHWGDALIDRLTDPADPKVGSLADLYRLSVEDIASCCSGTKFAQKCYDVLHSGKRVTVELLLASMNIPNLAVSTATDVVQAGFDTVDKILGMSYEDLLSVPNVGDVTARQILEGLSSRRQAISDLASVLTVLSPTAGPLSGLSFCITGSTSVPRKALEKSIMDCGGVVKSSVGSGTKYLVTNDPDTGSSKMQSAKKHGATVISEADLRRLMART
jgi:DNA ligase (NAD+)